MMTNPLETELRKMVHRVHSDAGHNVRGVLQIASSDEPRLSYYIAASQAAATVETGAHPAPDVKVSAPTQVFLKMFTGKFAFFDPVALADLSIEGNAELLIPLFDYFSDANETLAPFDIADQVRRGLARPDAIPRVECPSEALVREAFAEYQPLLITGAVERWPWGCRSWTPEYLERVFGDEPMLASDASGNAAYTVADFIERARTSGPALTGGGLLSKRMKAAAGYPGYFEPRDYRRPFGFLGTQGATTALHRDIAHNLAVCVFGRKRWTLVSPTQAQLVYSRHVPTDGPCGESCEVDIDAPDLERFPLFAQARPMEVVVEAGEILLVPSGWFHHVVSLELSLNVAYSMKWAKGHPGELALGGELPDFTGGEAED
jgi:putative sterol carrier protein